MQRARGGPSTNGALPASRVLLNYDAVDLTLEGALLAGFIAGPYTGAIVGRVQAVVDHRAPTRAARRESATSSAPPTGTSPRAAPA